MYFFNAMSIGWNVAVLSLYAIKRKDFVSTKCKQKICITKRQNKVKTTFVQNVNKKYV